MFFLIRSVFWLSVVYSSMSWTLDASVPAPHALRDAVMQTGLEMVGAAKDAAVGEARAWCVKSPDQCLADAARLTALVSANQNEDLRDEPADLVVTRSAAYPVPRPDPRRHVPSKELTRLQ